MSKDELPSIEDFNGDDNLPSIKDYLREEKAEELPSIDDYIDKEEEILNEATQTIEDAEGNSFTEIKDIVPPWPELVKMVNDVRADIPDIPEIKYYDKELEDLAEQISRVRDKISEVPEVRYYENEVEAICEQIDLVREQIKDLPEVKYYDEQVNVIEDRIDTLQTEVTNLPEVKYYDREIEAICSEIDQVRSEIPTFPKWVNEVNEVPDFSWIGKTFSVFEDDFTKVNDSIDTLKENIQLDIKKLVEDNEVRHFESKIEIGNDVKDLNNKLEEENNKIWKELRDSSLKIWEYHREFKDDDRKLKKQILGEYNGLKQNIKKELKELTEESVKTDDLLLKYFTDLKEEVSGIIIPEVKYYDDDLSYISEDLSDIRGDIASLKKLVRTIKNEQKNLSEGLLNEPPSEKESTGGQPDPLTPMDQKFATLDDLANHYRIFINRIQQQISTIGGGGAGFIKDLDDVTFDQTTGTNKLLIYDGAKWVGIASTAISGSATTLDGVLSEGNTSATGMSVGVITATNIFASNVNVAGTITYDDVTNVDSLGLGTFRSGVEVNTGTATTALLVKGDARVTGILTIGQGSITLDPANDTIKIGQTKLVRDTDGSIDFRDVATNARRKIKVDPEFSELSISGVVTATSFVKDSGTSSQFLKADGSVDSSTYITSADGGNADQLDGQEGTYYLNYNNFSNTPTIPTNNNQLTNGANFITASDNITGTSAGLSGSPNIIVTDIDGTQSIVSGASTAGSFVKSGGTSSQFLKADGSVDSSTYITSADGGNADQLDGQEGTYYLNYNNFSNTPTIPTNNNQLTNGANFITASNNITGTSAGLTGTPDITVDDITAGSVNVSGIVTATNIVSVKSDDGTSGRVDLYCESNNAHYARLQAPDHGAFSGNPTIKLPSSSGTLLNSDGSGASLTALNASNLGSGTVPDARFPATLPAASGVNLTALNASNLGSGTVPDARFPATLPAVSGASLTGLTGASAATYGDASNVAAITVDANGRITGISEVTISGGGGGSASDSFKTISVSGQSDVVADSSTDTLTLVAGSNMTITTDASTDTITLASSGGGGGGITAGKSIALAMVFG